MDTVFHLEVKQHVFNPRPEEILAFHEVNVEGTRQWLEWATRARVQRFVFFSSIKATNPLGPPPWSEASPQRPATSPYGASKFAAEEAVREWCAADSMRSALILRPAVVYGEGNSGNVAAMVDAIRQGRFFFAGRNDNVKSMIARDLLCELAIKLARTAEPGCEIYYLTDPFSESVREIGLRLARELNRPAPRTLPPILLWPAAWAGDAIQRITGKPFLINSDRLRALLETSHFSGERALRRCAEKGESV